MAYAKAFDMKDPDFIAEIYAVKMSDEDMREIFGEEELTVGDSVKMLTGRREGKIGVIVRASGYGTYIVEPYNDPYYNDPRHLTKLGPFTANELVQVKRPKGASTEFVAPVKVSVESESDENAELRSKLDDGFTIKGAKRGKGKVKTKRARRAKATKATKQKGENDMMEVNAKQKAKYLEQIEKVLAHVGSGTVVTRKELPAISEKLFGKPFMLTWVRKLGPENRADRGKYDLVKTKAALVGATAKVKAKAGVAETAEATAE